MNLTTFFAANTSVHDLYPNGVTLDAGTRAGLIVIGASSAVGLLLLVWAGLYIKKRRRHRRHSHHHQSTSTAEEALAAAQRGAPAAETHHRHHRRKRRREHRPRNPTLAETGGLPPVRHEEEPPSF